ncbi:hypothetical protein Taro_054399 [Colocasia esculenta]|uniref:Uncharacterized protein n=1 Tax=Colocasia esculenta TaxID=4460 RepID=A0A843XQG1_COLES|nr:hypothetical protein [Colocasia esculenta]
MQGLSPPEGDTLPVATWKLLMRKLLFPLVVREELQAVTVCGLQRLHPSVNFFLLTVNPSKGRLHLLQARASSWCQAWGRSSVGLRWCVCCVLYGGSLASLFLGGCRQELVTGKQKSGRHVLLLAASGIGLVAIIVTVFLMLFPSALDCCFHNLSIGAFRGGTGECVSLPSWHVWGPECFCLWTLDLVECSVSFLSRRVRVEGCFRMVSNSAGSAGVVVVCYHFSLEFLLLLLVASFPVGSECELQESVAVVAGCACYEHCRLVRSCCGLLTSLLELSRCFVCRVAPLVERCDTCLWLLSALCWLVLNSGEVLPEFFSVGSGRKLFVAVLSACLPLVKVRGLDHVCGPVFGQFAVLFVSKSLCCADGTVRSVACLLPLLSMGGSGWWCSTMVFGAMWCTVATFVVKVPPLELS